MNYKRDSFYLHPDTQEQIRVIFRVHLTMPATYDGYVDIEAFSEQQAAEIAMNERLTHVEWEYCEADKYAIEVFDVECDDPPANAMLIRRGYCKSDATLEGLFEPDNGQGNPQGESR
jgi:hypothetical protein